MGSHQCSRNQRKTIVLCIRPSLGASPGCPRAQPSIPTSMYPVLRRTGYRLQRQQGGRPLLRPRRGYDFPLWASRHRWWPAQSNRFGAFPTRQGQCFPHRPTYYVPWLLDPLEADVLEGARSPTASQLSGWRLRSMLRLAAQPSCSTPGDVSYHGPEVFGRGLGKRGSPGELSTQGCPRLSTARSCKVVRVRQPITLRCLHTPGPAARTHVGCVTAPVPPTERTGGRFGCLPLYRNGTGSW